MDVFIVMSRDEDGDWGMDGVMSSLEKAKELAEREAYCTDWGGDWTQIYYDDAGRRGVARCAYYKKRSVMVAYYIFIVEVDKYDDSNYRMYRL